MSVTTLSGPRRQSTVRRLVLSDFGIPTWTDYRRAAVLRDIVVRIGGQEVYVDELWPSMVGNGDVYIRDYDGYHYRVKRTLVYIRKG